MNIINSYRQTNTKHNELSTAAASTWEKRKQEKELKWSNKIIRNKADKAQNREGEQREVTEGM